METLPPKTDLRVVRVRTFRLGPDGLLALLRDLRRERFTGEAQLHFSQGALGEVKVKESSALPSEP